MLLRHNLPVTSPFIDSEISTRLHGVENVEEHLHGSKGNVPKVMFRADLTAKHNKFKEKEMVCILGSVCLR